MEFHFEGGVSMRVARGSQADMVLAAVDLQHSRLSVVERDAPFLVATPDVAALLAVEHN